MIQPRTAKDIYEMKLLLATRNQDKIREIKSVLKDTKFQFVTINKIAPKVALAEEGKTLEANAGQKAITAMRSTNLPCLAEDTGLEVFALGGKPGVLSARFAGPAAKYEENVKKLLNEMREIPENRRGARFRTIFALATPENKLYTFEGVCPGKIANESKGKNGFGYDSVFIPKGYQRTFGQMASKTKNRISHRAKALLKVRIFLNRYFSE